MGKAAKQKKNLAQRLAKKEIEKIKKEKNIKEIIEEMGDAQIYALELDDGTPLMYGMSMPGKVWKELFEDVLISIEKDKSKETIEKENE